MAEIWKPIAGYNGKYEISSFGRVKSHAYTSVRFIREQLAGKGYPKVSLRKDGKTQQHYIHRLVAEAFLDNPEQKTEVNHIDGNKRNNHVQNLEWVSRKENQMHAFNNGLLKNMENRERAIDVLRRPIICDQTGKVYASVSDAARELGVATTNISSILLGRRPHVKGYSFSDYDSSNPQQHEPQPMQPNRNRKPVICNETGITYNSLSEAERLTGFARKSIEYVAKGKKKSVKGYTFSYLPKD